MSEPSEEAKQAAWDEVNERQDKHPEQWNPRGYYVQQAIDAATARLRAENERLREALRYIQFQGECWTNTGDNRSLRQAMKEFAALATKALALSSREAEPDEEMDKLRAENEALRNDAYAMQQENERLFNLLSPPSEAQQPTEGTRQ